MLRPVNKYLVVEQIKQKKASEDITILLPEGSEVNQSRFAAVKVVNSMTSSPYEREAILIVPTHSVEQVDFLGESYQIVLESHVIGYISETHDS
tara:strand:+ start:669 stop:950 length:282 start_codon:yes stop_codon:yes gene_type:complete